METNESIPAERLIYPLPEARVKLGGISHSGLYNLVANGAIRITKIGRRSYITADELDAFVSRISRCNTEENSDEAAKR